MYDVIIIGMGISGITAAIYAKRSNKKVLLIDKAMPGGTLNNIDKVSNYPGLVDISGPDFAANLFKQIKTLDIPYKLEEVKSLKLTDNVKVIETTNNTYQAKNVILAMGRRPKMLGLENESSLLGRGISTCALCDAFFYKDKDIAVVGTGNSALQETLYLANIVNKIYLINRRDGFRGDSMLVDQIKSLDNIEIIYNANIKELNSENNKLSEIILANNKHIKVEGLFIYIGSIPETKIVPEDILDSDGYVIVDKYLKTKLPGVYAIGDIIKKNVYQLVTAAADGARVISYLED